MNKDDLGLLCVCAERYALGRQTYIVGMVCGVINSCLKDLSDKDINVLYNDISNPLFEISDIDKPEWDRLLDAVIYERNKRMGNGNGVEQL